MVTVCAPTHPLASIEKPISLEEFGRHVQLVVPDNQPGTEKTQVAVAGEREWLVTDLGQNVTCWLRDSAGATCLWIWSPKTWLRVAWSNSGAEHGTFARWYLFSHACEEASFHRLKSAPFSCWRAGRRPEVAIAEVIRIS